MIVRENVTRTTFNLSHFYEQTFRHFGVAGISSLGHYLRMGLSGLAPQSGSGHVIDACAT